MPGRVLLTVFSFSVLPFLIIEFSSYWESRKRGDNAFQQISFFCLRFSRCKYNQIGCRLTRAKFLQPGAKNEYRKKTTNQGIFIKK
jgi:hypothetical protein